MGDVHHKKIQHEQNGNDNDLILELQKEIEQMEKEKENLSKEIENLALEESCKKQCLHRYEEQSKIVKQRLKHSLETNRKLEKLTTSNCKSLVALMEDCDNSVKALSIIEKEMSETTQKLNVAMDLIKTLRDNNAVLSKKGEDLEQQLTARVSQSKALEDACTKMGQSDDKQELDEYKNKIASLEALVKNLEIRIKFLDFQRLQKIKECDALSAMHDELQNNTC